LTGWILSEGACEHATENDLINQFRFDARSFQGFPDYDRAKFHRWNIFQGTTEFSDSSAAGTDKEYFTHCFSP
jgi:hypothetical protein